LNISHRPAMSAPERNSLFTHSKQYAALPNGDSCNETDRQLLCALQFVFGYLDSISQCNFLKRVEVAEIAVSSRFP